MEKRIKYIDLAKGLCILLVVFYHISKQEKDNSPFIYTLSVFRMPLYFFLSGLFFKEYEGFFGFFIRKVNKLLIPFLFFYLTTSFALPNILHYGFGVHVAASQSLGIGGLWAFITDEQFANNPIWFLWALFLVNILFYSILVPIKHFTTNSNLIATFITVICFAIGFIGSSFLAGRYNLLAFLIRPCPHCHSSLWATCLTNILIS